MSEIAANFTRVQERIADAATRAQRDPANVQLVAVSKAQPFEKVAALFAAGQRDFGENRIPAANEVVARANATIDPDAMICWHFVGHIQSRKADDVVQDFDVLHAVDSVSLAQRLSRKADDAGRTLSVMVQCNVSGEASKYGIDAARWADDTECFAAVAAAVTEIGAQPRLDVVGLMTMAPIVPVPDDARPVFVSLRGLRDALVDDNPTLSLRELSMGMTDDFEVAIEEGATIVRVGRALFGERPA